MQEILQELIQEGLLIDQIVPLRRSLLDVWPWEPVEEVDSIGIARP